MLSININSFNIISIFIISINVISIKIIRSTDSTLRVDRDLDGEGRRSLVLRLTYAIEIISIDISSSSNIISIHVISY